MKLLRATSVLVLSAFALTGCDDDDATGIEISDLAGDWTASQFQYDEIGGAGFTIDAISQAGGTVTLDVASDGTFTGSLNIPGLTPGTQAIGGSFTLLDADNLSIDFNAQTESYGLFGDFDASFTLVNDVLTFVNDDTSFDFPNELEEGAGIAPRDAVPATLTVTLER